MRILTGILLFLVCSTALKVGAQPHAFKGNWITRSEDAGQWPAPLFRKEFSLMDFSSGGKQVKSAKLFICGLGYHITTVNGKAVSDGVLEQGFTKYDSRLLYSVYDVTGLLSGDRNCIGVELGNSWYNMQSATIWGFNSIGWRKSPRLLLDLVISYSDGSQQVVSSDGSWKCATGASQFNSMYAGEIYDARKAVLGWNLAGFDDNNWKGSLLTAAPGGVLSEQLMPGVKVIRKISPVSLKKVSGSTWLYDMGENFAGVAMLKVRGRAGDTIKMHYEESLDSMGRLDRRRNASHMNGPVSDPVFQTDIYILKGGGLETYVPRFTYHGFRYVEVEASGGTTLNRSSLTGLFYSTGFSASGSFESSDPLLNKMYAAALQSYRSNYNSIPTDCPQREKMGWLADAHLATELGLWNYDAISSYRKFLGDIRDVQLADGRLPGVAPTKGAGYSWIDPADSDFGPTWGSAIVLISWQVYLFGGDVSVLRENYEAIKKYTDFLSRRSVGNLYLTGISDWLAPVPTGKVVTSTGYYYQDALLLSKMAAVLGKSADAVYYGELAENIRVAYQAQYFDVVSGRYKEGTVTALATPLYQGLVYPQHREAVARALVERLKANGYTTEFGMMGAKYVLSSLSDAGYADEAYRLLTNLDKGGWASSVSAGATTFYEHWTGEASLNHVWPGIFTDWLFNSLAGIRPDEKAPGFRHFFVHPVFPGQLGWIKVSHRISYGEIRVEWKKTAGQKKIKLNVVVPNGTTATLELKDGRRALSPGKHRLVVKL